MDPVSQIKERLFAIKDLPSLESFGTDIYSIQGWRASLQKAYETVDWGTPPKGVGPLHRAAALWKLGKRDQAAKVLADRNEAEDETGEVFLSKLLLELGRPTEAVERLVPLLKSKAKSSQVKTTMLEAMRAAGDEENWGKKIRLWEDDLKNRPEYLYQKARWLEDQGDYEDAMDAFRKVLSVDSAHRGALFRLALLEVRVGSEETALELYERLRALRPSNVNALINLSVLYEDRGRFEEAHRVLREVLREHPEHPRARLFERDAVASKSMYYDEDLERKNDKRLQIMRTPVTDFELSVRSRNCLKQMNIETLGDLVTKTEQELLAHKNFGETSLAEIKAMLAQRNLRLGMVRRGDDIPGLTDPRAGRNREILARPITELELSVRSRKCMERMNINTIGELCNLNDQDLLGVRNFGQTSLVEIRTKLGELGLKLKGDP